MEGGLGNNENSNQSEIYLRGKQHKYRREKLVRLFGPLAQTVTVIVEIMFTFKGNQEPLEEPLRDPGLRCDSSAFHVCGTTPGTQRGLKKAYG